jgi:hypothetical protein
MELPRQPHKIQGSFFSFEVRSHPVWVRGFLLVLVLVLVFMISDIVILSQAPVLRFTAVRLERQPGQWRSTGSITKYSLGALSLVFGQRQYLVMVA